MLGKNFKLGKICKESDALCTYINISKQEGEEGVHVGWFRF